MAHPYNDVGRRLYAAIGSYQLGVGIDYFLKNKVPEEVDEFWAVEAQRLQHILLKSKTNGYPPPNKE